MSRRTCPPDSLVRLLQCFQNVAQRCACDGVNFLPGVGAGGVFGFARFESAETGEALQVRLKGQEARLAAIRQAQEKKKADELTQEEKDDKANTEKAVQEQKDKKQQILADYAKGNSIVHQLIDLALLQNGMLKGEALDKFLKRSIELIK